MSRRRIILLLDGTWNEDEISPTSTNIVRIRELIGESLDQTPTLSDTRGDVNPRTFKDREYVVFYERGVGTGPFDRVRGGVLGVGLDINIRRAYRFLAFHYKPGDEIFIFGFSRGSYTARSLTGYIGSIGLLRLENCTVELEAKAWAFYRTPPSERLSGIWKQLEPYVYPRGEVRISCLALFDTVGALGVPLQGFRRLNRQNFAFHDVELSSLVDRALHALAIDENRIPFEASVWRINKFIYSSAKVEQVWFSGVHSDIGGGYFDLQKRKRCKTELDDITLDWMIKRVRAYFSDFPISETSYVELKPNQTYLSDQHNPRTKLYKFYRNAVRSIANKDKDEIPPPIRHKMDKVIGNDPTGHVVNESVHISAIRRLGRKVKIDGREHVYMPVNLLSCLPDLWFLYSSEDLKPARSDMISITSDDGNTEKPQSKHVFSELRDAWQRLKYEAPHVTRQLGWTFPAE